MSKIKIYINDNYIDILKNKIYYHLVLKSIDKGNIVNSSLFIKEIKNQKIFSSIFNYSIDILLNKEIKEKDILYYKTIFEELNFNNINIISTSKFMEDNTLIVNSNYYILYANKNYYYFEKELLYSYINYYDISKLKIISKAKIPLISKVKTYYYNNSETYFIK